MKFSKPDAKDVLRRRILDRRAFLRHAGQGAGVLGLQMLGGTGLLAIACSDDSGDLGPLGGVDANGLDLPAGFSSRVVAVSGQQVGSTNFVWHPAPDGGATFATSDGGWIYVSNSEVSRGGGGVGAIRFAADASIVDAYSILGGTTRNCAGGITPWDTWLSCEEHAFGEVYECDPYSPGSQGVVLPALGTFNHEAAAIDPVHEQVYLTEDEFTGRLYRFSPTAYPSLNSGLLEVAEILDPGAMGPIVPGEKRSLAWHTVPDPRASSLATRFQVPQSTAFDGGEGCSYAQGFVYFSTKGDDRVWKIDTQTDEIEIVYDRATSSMPFLSGVDNVLATDGGTVYVAEDPGQLQVVALTPAGEVKPLLRLAGASGTEVTGLAFDPSGQRLYLSSQRNPGTTYEVTGPF